MLGMLHGFLKEAAGQRGCERGPRAAAASRCGPAELKWGSSVLCLPWLCVATPVLLPAVLQPAQGRGKGTGSVGAAYTDGESGVVVCVGWVRGSPTSLGL